MASISSIVDLFEALGRDPTQLVGQLESDWLDFKKEPYFLDEDIHCLHLARDVTAMANSGEGVIVIGVETTPHATLREEVASRLRPVSEGVIDGKRVQDIVRSWVCPRLDVEVRSHAVPTEDGKLWTILVKRQRERDLPFLVAKEFPGEKGPDRYAFGVYKRHGSDNVPYLPSQVQQWLHEGYTSSVATESPAADASLDEQADAIVQDDLAALALSEEEVWYYIQARPTVPTTVPRFYRGAAGSIYDVLTNIPTARRDGFSLPDGQPDRPSWDGLRVVWPETDSVSISRNGITTAIMGQRYLTWAAERFAPNGQIWINPLALVEFTFEFWRFYVSQVVERIDRPVPIAWRAGMHNLGLPYRVLLPGEPLRAHVPRPHASPSTSDDFDLPWSESSETDPGRLAFTALGEVYAGFGLGEDTIPCSQAGTITASGIIEAVRP